MSLSGLSASSWKRARKVRPTLKNDGVIGLHLGRPRERYVVANSYPGSDEQYTQPQISVPEDFTVPNKTRSTNLPDSLSIGDGVFIVDTNESGSSISLSNKSSELTTSWKACLKGVCANTLTSPSSPNTSRIFWGLSSPSSNAVSSIFISQGGGLTSMSCNLYEQ
ncbi:hypothetical protein PNOK_0734800 [Pyrrhoderma noxium]|uniref:Uncharacterized protein n=1 Tax=Pyrrhoderma noxium TaxID=2282107 RepID=A0A286UCN7_9AGAM|nr:hypothetical protein PNOK_0734800 [Pyrrhoderma noxium]